MGRNDNHADFVCDVYGGQWNDEFSLTQTITGLPQGLYRVKVQGYNRDGDAAAKRIVFGDETGIVSEELNVKSEKIAPAYNLQGQRVSEDYKGITIVKGKKVKK
ncbi:MAG: hypothetical protein IJ539_06495 [Prevotella sp.]|nr:hypothetical protein [Prevotella sp.]